MIDYLYKTTPYLEEVVKQTGYPSLGSLLFLHWLVKNVKPDCIAELGTGYGCSTIFMALALETGKIISIDDYRGDPAKNIIEPKENLIACKVLDKVELIEGNSKDVWITESPEVVFMDASHNDADLQQEYAVLKCVLPKDHIIVIDDVFAQDVYNFVLRLSKMVEYESCFILKLHDGVAVLNTNIDKYFEKINDAIWRAIHD